MEKVLIVDSDLGNLDTLERVLRKEFKVFRAGNGFEAIHVLDREGEMALVISELSMPVVDGVEFLMGIMHAYPDTVRVVLTRSLDPDLLLASVNDLKLFRYMVKPFKREDLLLVVRQGIELYRFGRAQKVPVGVLQFPEPKPEYLTIEIDQDKRQEQVEALISSEVFQSLAHGNDLAPPAQTSSENFAFLDDYQTPDIQFSFGMQGDSTAPQQEDDGEDTIFLIREFVTQLAPENPTTEDDTGSLDANLTKLQNAANDREEDTKPQSNETDSLAPQVKQAKRTKVTKKMIADKKQRDEKNNSQAEDKLIQEIDTLIQKLEEEESPKKPAKKSDNPLDSPEFRELQRQSNDLIARIIRSWG